jgi:type II secretory pathway pseudopilin PulG
LIELLVVMGIIGILVGMLLPAVQAAREAARKTQCQNNLKQVGLAFMNHHDQFGGFPTGGWDWFYQPTYTNGSPAIGALQQAGWGFQILPYLEQTNVWKGGPGQTDQERAIVAIGTPLSVFFCPTRRAPQTIPYSDPEYLNGATTNQAMCDYAGSNYEGTGVVKRYDWNRIADIRDGTSNTLLVAEKRLNLSRLGQVQDDDDIGYTSGWDQDTIRSTDQPPAPDYRADPADSNATGQIRFGSSHTGGFNAVMADGSGRFIKYSIDPRTFTLLGNKADGLVIGGDY